MERTDIILDSGAALVKREICPEDADELTDLAFLSKQFWGYNRMFMSRARVELRWSEECFRHRELHGELCEGTRSEIVGFYLLAGTDQDVPELDALFVHPRCMGRGIGTLLLHSALNLARKMELKGFVVESDPFSAGFYKVNGGTWVGERSIDDIPGRTLPLYHFSW